MLIGARAQVAFREGYFPVQRWFLLHILRHMNDHTSLISVVCACCRICSDKVDYLDLSNFWVYLWIVHPDLWMNEPPRSPSDHLGVAGWLPGFLERSHPYDVLFWTRNQTCLLRFHHVSSTFSGLASVLCGLLLHGSHLNVPLQSFLQFGHMFWFSGEGQPQLSTKATNSTASLAMLCADACHTLQG